MSQKIGSPKGRRTYRNNKNTDNSLLNSTAASWADESESDSDASEDEMYKEVEYSSSREYMSNRRTLSPSPTNLNKNPTTSRTIANRSPSPLVRRPQEYTNVSRGTISPSRHTTEYQQPLPNTIKSNSKSMMYFAIIALVVSLAAVATGMVMGIGSSNETFIKKNCSTIDRLKLAHPSQDKYLWKAVKSGIEAVINGRPPKPSIFLFLHQNEISTQRIIKDIVNAAAECFDPTLKAVVLDSEDFNSEDVLNDHGRVIVRYQEALSNGGVAFIADLNKISGKAAKALHFICDYENPIVNNVVIFLTLKPVNDYGKPVQVAEDTLNSIWSSTIDKNTLGALIARVTDQVIKLHPE